LPPGVPPVKLVRSDLDRTRQIAPQILEHLRERILSLDLRPGTPLSRATLQQQFGTSQTPVRDALMRLEEEGLVTVYPQYATLVSKIDVELARQTHFMRRALEQEAVFTIASSDLASDVGERLAAANATLVRLAETQENAAFSDADRAFHWIIFEAARIEHIWPIVRRHSGHMDRLRRLDLSTHGKQRIIDAHQEIVDAIKSRMPEAAEAAMKRHLSGTLSAIEEIASQFPDYLQLR
jgi:GntR family transcriptional regulator, rspAB operon transcriptional repressor